eukprot:CAMPEP_0119103148 /NCGR_PEP_ID=MMETSP1180-20130426/1675_1 /TAXON_ID=3052 ORGANISM="Chlamydomonas cf sp, Strain CCMP681" /NCGR_SAMPLE_ID=MMETSP1180 /ASSEMBLY_ACC=CAM_ASM_000741 /LENGTH=82 /DNA_ID=CAMNT_0007087591 /DNA_START=567 /DNA_END=816 /DNA_ORIENTATION=-
MAWNPDAGILNDVESPDARPENPEPLDAQESQVTCLLLMFVASSASVLLPCSPGTAGPAGDIGSPALLPGLGPFGQSREHDQ